MLGNTGIAEGLTLLGLQALVNEVSASINLTYTPSLLAREMFAQGKKRMHSEV